jgi:shikimate dehydrogenase
MIKAFVVGHPIRHSRSPLIHGFWLRQFGLEGTYERIDVATSDFPNFVRSFGDMGFAGGNVTIPHKEAAFAAVDRVTERADRVRAVNTLWTDDEGLIWGDNTDVAGFVDNLAHNLGTDWARTVDTALVIGAGGAARAVVAGLQDLPLRRILLANRTAAKADALAQECARVGMPVIVSGTWEDLAGLAAESGLIVNTTSLGMSGQPSLDLDLAQVRSDAIVTDIVYVPLETPLLRAARERGLRTVGGLGMLLHQAVPGFVRWFGVTPQVTPELEAVIRQDIEGAG